MNIKYLLNYLLYPVKIIVCDISRNKYKIIYNDKLIVDQDLYITKRIIKQFLRYNTTI